jgi:hypothetical protein
MRSIKLLLFFGVLGVFVYACFQFAMPYYKHFRFKSDAEFVVKFNVRDEEEMLHRLVDKAEEVGLYIPEDDFVLERTKVGYNMEVSWSNTVDLFGLYRKKLDFTVVIKQ